jgi:glucokinase
VGTAVLVAEVPIATPTTLLGDIGGTNARFALLAEGKLGTIVPLPVAEHANAIEAISHFLSHHAGSLVPSAAILAIAGPVVGDRCVILNSQWVIDASELRAAYGFEKVRLLNDFEALAWALPHLTASDAFTIGDGRAAPDAPMVVLGPGTGLGVAAVVPTTQGRVVIASEGGHATLPAVSAREAAVIGKLREQFGHVSAERALSGPGLENLYRAIAVLDAVTVEERGAEAITQAAIDGTCPVSRAAVDMFCAMLGTVASDLALIFRAQGGIYIAGGIAPRILDFITRSEFRARFVAKGRYRNYLAAIPTSVILRPDVAFLGLQSLLECESKCSVPT